MSNALMLVLLMTFFPQVDKSILINDRGGTRTMGIVSEDLVSLIFPVDGIPHFKADGLTRHHTYVDLDVHGDKPSGRMYSRVGRNWISRDGFSIINIECWLFESPEDARMNLRESILGNTAMNKGSLFGGTIGDECWSSDNNPARIFFVLGRTVVKVRVWTTTVRTSNQLVLGVSHDLAAEALAYGMDYRVRQRPKFLASGDNTAVQISSGLATWTALDR